MSFACLFRRVKGVFHMNTLNSAQVSTSSYYCVLLRKEKNIFCIINIVFSTNPKHSPIPATGKEMTSTPAQTSTAEES